MKLIIDGKLRDKVFVGVGIVLGVRNSEYPGELIKVINSVINEVKAKYTLDKLKGRPNNKALQGLLLARTRHRPNKAEASPGGFAKEGT
jgi:hypothetical protein